MSDLKDLPVFTNPFDDIKFYADDPSSYKQLLRIFNPYDFEVKFKVTVATAGHVRKYQISTSFGIIKAHHSVDIILKHLDVSQYNIGLVEQVRVSMCSYGSYRGFGRKDLNVVLLETMPPAEKQLHGHTSDAELFQQLEVDPVSVGHLRQHPLIQERRSNNKLIYVALIILGAVALALPKEGDFSEYFPNCLPRPTFEMKLMVAFLLGVISVLLLQS